MENILESYGFTESDFRRVRALIRELAGIALGDVKREMVYNRLSRRLRALKIESFHEYLDVIGSDECERVAFVNALTTNLTAFFREPTHFVMLDAFLRKAKRPMRIWCSAASTGEEPYSIVMTACESLRTLEPPCNVLATDINTEVLAQGEAGVYALDRCKDLTQERLHAFFLRGSGPNEGFVRVRPEVRSLVVFREINLRSNAWPLNGDLDVIFCRNVLIYFDKPTQRDVIGRMVGLLRPGGLLFTGHSELISGFNESLKPVGRTTYERTSTA